MGCKRGRPRPTASSNSHITRVLYLFNTRPARGGSDRPRLLHELLFLLGCSSGTLFFPNGGRYGPIVAGQSGPFSRQLGWTRYILLTVGRINPEGGHEDDLYRLVQTAWWTTIVETVGWNQLTDQPFPGHSSDFFDLTTPTFGEIGVGALFYPLSLEIFSKSLEF